MCPKLCERYTTTSLQPIVNCGKSARARPLFCVCVFSSRHWRGCGWTPSGSRLARLPPPAGAAPAPSLCHGRKAGVLLLPATTVTFEVLGRATVHHGSVPVLLRLSCSCVISGSGGLSQAHLCAGLHVVGL